MMKMLKVISFEVMETCRVTSDWWATMTEGPEQQQMNGATSQEDKNQQLFIEIILKTLIKVMQHSHFTSYIRSIEYNPVL